MANRLSLSSLSLSLALLLAVCVLKVELGEGFHLQSSPAWRHAIPTAASTSSTPLVKTQLSAVSAATTMIKKSKAKEIDSLLKNATESHNLVQYMANGAYPEGVLKPVDFYSSVMLRFESVSVMPEYNKRTKTGFIMGLPGPEIMGGVLRDAGSRAIIASMDTRSGGTTLNEFERLTREQSKARKMVPGPLPVVWHDFVISDTQINLAAALGAAAITLSPDFSDDLGALVEHSRRVGLEPIIMVDNVEHAKIASEMTRRGARCVCFQNQDDKSLIALRDAASFPEGTMFIARLRPETDFSSYAEIDSSWLLRDSGFHVVWPSPDAVYATGMSDVYTVINAMRSKAGRHFISPRQFLMDRKREGAQEYLGDILY